MSLSRLAAEFASPPPAYRGKPFWSWNGRLHLPELHRQIRVIELMGMGGFFMHSRTGLATEYLGDEWFRLINSCADEAERRGLEAWLYDEDRWPSGTAGGMVTEEPRFRMRYLRMDEVCAERFAWPDDCLAAFAVRLDGLTVSEVERLSHGQRPAAGIGTTVLAFGLAEAACDSAYNGFTYVNTMNADATARYLEITHERYARECGTRLGRSIPGIFTDEPHRGALMDPFGGEGERSSRQVPWTDDLAERFREAFGYDLTDRLPELFLQLDGEQVSPVKWHYVELLMRLFLGRFAAPYAEWCRSHGLAVTGHILHEDSLTAQTAMCGSVMRYYEHMDYPGVDVLTEGNRSFWVAKQLQSAASQLGRRWLLSELYGCTGWQMPFSGHKAAGDWQALYGVNVRCHHLLWYTMEGEAKRDYPASIFHQSSWWPLYRHVEDYFSRIGLLMDQGRRACRLLVVHPVESVWCQVHAGWSHHLTATTEGVRAVERMFAELLLWLQGAQLDFDYADEETLGRLGRTEHGTLRVGEGAYAAVLVGGLVTMRSSTLEILRRASQAGVPVIWAGEPPAYVDALRSDAPRRLATGMKRVAWDRHAVVAACERSAGRDVMITHGAEGATAEAVHCQLRRDAGGRTFLMALNTNREAAVGDAVIRVRGSGPVEEWDCRLGRRSAAPHSAAGDWVEIPAHFEPAGERVYVIGPTDTPAPAPPALREVERMDVPGPFRYHLSEPNVCVLDRCEYRVGDGPWAGPLEVPKADQSVRARFGIEPRGGSMIQPWLSARRPRPPSGRATVRFGFQIDVLPEGAVDLAVERADSVSVLVNGTPVRAPVDARPWIDVCFTRLRIPPRCLRTGGNVVELSCQYVETAGFESVYLLGSFGVGVCDESAVLTALPSKLAVGDVTQQGLPFYGGAITYELGCAVPHALRSPGRRFALRAPGMSAACALAVCTGDTMPDTITLDLSAREDCSDAERLIAWAPYEADVTKLVSEDKGLALRLYLTRRNTFGPLHQLPVHTPGYGPGNWVTEGDAFSDAYVLWPSGLLSPPQIIVREP